MFFTKMYTYILKLFTYHNHWNIKAHFSVCVFTTLIPIHCSVRIESRNAGLIALSPFTTPHLDVIMVTNSATTTTTLLKDDPRMAHFQYNKLKAIFWGSLRTLISKLFWLNVCNRIRSTFWFLHEMVVFSVSFILTKRKQFLQKL